ncbi:hypothetical protein ABES03_11025 [Neobacillus rhizosphaerae]|uniref:hypothetical protein n=1 Tax=Neobacillus rhizosphaerae TaxID=2880965 RepID=UPI003D286991
MDKKLFKAKVLNLLAQDVTDLTSENKIKYMKKWIRDYEQEHHGTSEEIETQDSIKVGILVRTTLRKIIKAQLLTDEKVKLLQNTRYSKITFDINYPFLKKAVWDSPLSEQRKINGYNRYWADEELINGERYLVCSQWFERNKQKFIKWIKELEH